ncbi:MAG: homoaconitase [Planctomycetota bacterium]|nr:MAG: homoaconitase [Planctomycetota bacterium]
MQNYVEKIVQRYAVGLPAGHEVHSGDYVMVRPLHVMTHDNTSAVMEKFKAIGATRMADPKQPVFVLDHDIQNKDPKNLKKYAAIEAFAKEHGVDFYPAGRGIGHQVITEEGYVWPGALVVASDSHSNLYGGLGALGTPVVRTDAASIWATGQTWWQVPPVAKCVLKGRLRAGATGKDVIITLCGMFNNDEVLNHCVEFVGDGVAELPIDQRLTIANMTTEWGALAGVFPCDSKTIAWLRNRATVGAKKVSLDRVAALEKELPKLQPDPGCYYAKKLELDLGTVTPHVSGPDTVTDMTSVAEMQRRKVPVQKAYIVSCVNSRVDDIADAARVLRGQKVAPGVELYVAAASSEVEAESAKRGDWQVLLDAGAKPLPPGCGPCIGLGAGLLQDGEVGISATNRNFKGRMGSRNAQAYLASPAVVAASAVSGFISGPEGMPEGKPQGSCRVAPRPERPKQKVPILPGFPERVEGELLWCDADNLNTDGIYPGKYTYREDLKPEEMAKVAMENYDPRFQELARAGDVLVGGYNFGTGSSREQAATALKYRGLPLVAAGSFSDTYKRNAINNGYPLVDCPELVDWLRERFGEKAATRRTGLMAVVDFAAAEIRVDGRSFAMAPLGPAAQELVIMGGLEALVAQRIGAPADAGKG